MGRGSRHSKNAGTMGSEALSYAEKKALGYGTAQERLGKVSNMRHARYLLPGKSPSSLLTKLPSSLLFSLPPPSPSLPPGLVGKLRRLPPDPSARHRPRVHPRGHHVQQGGHIGAPGSSEEGHQAQARGVRGTAEEGGVSLYNTRVL